MSRQRPHSSLAWGLLVVGCAVYSPDLLYGERVRDSEGAGGGGAAGAGAVFTERHCVNRVLDADESDIDCGGLDCSRCTLGRQCRADVDCRDSTCTEGTCLDASCVDGLENLDETDVDCGGPCLPCAAGMKCGRAEDCFSGRCISSECQEPTCDDRTKNGSETDVDCGGTCGGCQPERSCLVFEDCAQPSAGASGVAACDDERCRLSCAVGTSDCNGVAADGCETDTLESLLHCGACDAACELDHATAECTSGICRIQACEDGFADCNGLPADGCEVDLQNDLVHCGECFRPCSTLHGEASCVEGACSIVCDTAYGNCDDSARDNGCEGNLDENALHCGACGRSCAEESLPPGETPYCSDGVCGSTLCDEGLGDCDGDGSCTDSLTTASDCLVCGNACNVVGGTPKCDPAIGCVVDTCDEGRANCDGRYGNGCETALEIDGSNCGGCGVVCGGDGPHVVSASCVSGQCVSECAPGFCADASPEASCTVPLGTPENCGSCDDVCDSVTPYCVDGACSRVPEEACQVLPIPAKNTWTASAFQSSTPTQEPPSRGIDGTTTTRYANGAPMRAWDWYRVDFGKKVALNRIEIVHDDGDYARGYDIVVSDEPPEHETPADVSGTNSLATLSVDTPMLVGRYLHVRQTGSSESWWTIRELDVFCKP